MTEPSPSDRERLESGCAELGVVLHREQADALLAFVDRIYLWNRSAGLTTIRREDAIRLHILDSLAAAAFIETGPCADLGTGAGLPGLVLAIADPGRHYVLIESNRKKCSFLLETVSVLGAGNVEVVQSDVARLGARRFPTVISRAFRPPAEAARIAAELAEPGGTVVLMMANPEEREIEALATVCGAEVRRQLRFRLPVGNEPRAIVSLQLPNA